jgi:hypothetical protein
MFDKIKKINWKIIFSVSYAIKNVLENNFLYFIFFLNFTKKNRDKIWKMKMLKEDEIKKKI